MENLKSVTDAIAQGFKNSPIPRTDRQLAPMSIDAGEVIRNFLGKSREQVEVEFQYDVHMEDYTARCPWEWSITCHRHFESCSGSLGMTGLRIYLFGYLQPRLRITPDPLPVPASHDRYNLNSQSKPHPRSGVGGLDVRQKI